VDVHERGFEDVLTREARRARVADQCARRRQSATDRWLSGAGALGAVLWLVTWDLSQQVNLEINRGPGGLTEGQIRALLNPGLVLLLPLAWGLRRAQAGRDGQAGLFGAWITTAGLLLQLIGNFLEYGWWDNGVTEWGWALLTLGFLPLTAGWLLLGIAALRGRALDERVAAVPVLMAMLLPIAFATGLASPDLAVRQPAVDRLLIGTGIGWLALAIGLFVQSIVDNQLHRSMTS
jgi:hypothetical protein